MKTRQSLCKGVARQGIVLSSIRSTLFLCLFSHVRIDFILSVRYATLQVSSTTVASTAVGAAVHGRR
jgi:hypothetical protein